MTENALSLDFGGRGSQCIISQVAWPRRWLRRNCMFGDGTLPFQFADQLLHGAFAFLGWIGEIDFGPPADVLGEDGV